MPRRLTTPEFIDKAKAVHGDRFDYSSVDYVNAHTNVTIICPNHGPFPQTPNNHLSGQGCPDCGGSKPLTTASFIQKAKAVHGDHYDYSEVEYVNAHTYVTIICTDHGPFRQTPNKHLSKNGCPDCGGSKILTTEEFIERAKAIHGDRYNYSQVKYVNKSTNVTIICLDHGAFDQTPANHVRNEQGCPDCGGTKPLTTDTFITKAKAVHGDRYDYAQVEYSKSSTKVTILCPDHGAFEQAANMHLSGQGCPDCGGSKPLTSATFIEKAKAVHGDRYDYAQVEYLKSNSKVTIYCPDHGPFEQTPNSHLSKAGCPDCAVIANALSKRHSRENFIKRARGVHGDRYTYSSVNYVNANTKVTIFCPDHGPFEQTPTHHLSKKGCPDCAGNKRLNTETFVDKARQVHGNRYDYTQVKYVNNSTNVTIICLDHGAFQQAPASHLSGSGCPDCADYGFNPNDRAVLYYVAITTDDGDTRYKIGITNRTVEERFRAPDLARIRIVKIWQYGSGRAAAERESEILRLNAGDRYYGPDILRDGNSEMFTHDILGLDS